MYLKPISVNSVDPYKPLSFKQHISLYCIG